MYRIPHSKQLYIDLKICLFALSTADVSSEARYMRVVFSDSCPKASLMVARGMFLHRAMLAQPCLALYKAGISEKIDAKKIINNNEYQ